MRDAQSLLDQLLAFGGDRLTADTSTRSSAPPATTGWSSSPPPSSTKDAKRALELLARCADEGLQLGELLDQLIDYWRGLMLVNCADGRGRRDLTVAEQHQETLTQQARALTLDTILAGLDVLTTTKSRLRTTSHGQVLLEMAVVRLSRLDDLVPVAQLAHWLSQPGSAAGGEAARPLRPQPAPSPTASKKNGLTAAPEAFGSRSNGSLRSVRSAGRRPPI